MFPGTFAAFSPWNESSREQKFLEVFTLRSKNTGEQKVPEPMLQRGKGFSYDGQKHPKKNQNCT